MFATSRRGEDQRSKLRLAGSDSGSQGTTSPKGSPVRHFKTNRPQNTISLAKMSPYLDQEIKHRKKNMVSAMQAESAVSFESAVTPSQPIRLRASSMMRETTNAHSTGMEKSIFAPGNRKASVDVSRNAQGLSSQQLDSLRHNLRLQNSQIYLPELGKTGYSMTPGNKRLANLNDPEDAKLLEQLAKHSFMRVDEK